MKYLKYIIILLFVFTMPCLAQEKRPLSLSFNSNWYPYSYKTSTGETKGILVDIIKQAFTRMDEKIEISHYPWKRVQLLVKHMKHDGFITVPTSERLKYTDSSKGIVITIEMKAFASIHSPKFNEMKAIRKPEGLRPFYVCDIFGNGWAKKLFAEYKIKAKFVETNSLCFKMINVGHADLTISAVEVAYSILNKLGLSKEIVELPYVYRKMEFTLMINKKSKYISILPKFDEVIKTMHADGTIKKIIQENTGFVE